MDHTLASFRDSVNEAEWDLRVDLAGCHRLLARFGMSKLTEAGAAARLHGAHDFLVKPYFHLFDEVTASSLVRLDLDGNVLSAGDQQLEEGWEFNPANTYFFIEIFKSRPDVCCVIHTHSIAGMAVSALREGLLPITQEALRFHGQFNFYEYNGVVESAASAQNLVQSLGTKRILIMRNHGFLVAGRTVPEAFDIMFHFEQAARAQLAALATTKELLTPPKQLCEFMGLRYERNEEPAGRRQWPALQRLLEHVEPGYST